MRSYVSKAFTRNPTKLPILRSDAKDRSLVIVQNSESSDKETPFVRVQGILFREPSFSLTARMVNWNDELDRWIFRSKDEDAKGPDRNFE